ncbi:MAG: hypothetical protein RSB34_02030 [Muribaculaceae bacterium]
MKKVNKIIFLGIVATAMVATMPSFSQGHRSGGSSGTSSREQSTQREETRNESYKPTAPSNNNHRRPDDAGTQAPTQENTNRGTYTPGNTGTKPPSIYRPGFREDHREQNRPTTPPSGNRPGYGHGTVQPGYDDDDYGYGGDYHPNYRPSTPGHKRQYHQGYYLPPPQRPYRPYCRPIPRPVPPPNYRPYYGASIIDNILGLTFGIAYATSLDYLYDNGYSVDGYDNNTVYLRNVHQMSYIWDDATLNYNSYGNLSSMQFVDSSGYRNTSRYDRLYRELCRKYGYPVTTQNTQNGFQGVWYGRGAQNYVSLEYDVNYINGQLRYFTILSYGY